jgi:hypothetical protein
VNDNRGPMQAAARCDIAQDARLIARKIRGKRTGATSGESPLRRLERGMKAFGPIPLRNSLDCRHPRDETLMERPALDHDGLGDLACREQPFLS